ncbi:MAG: hypothetical protein ACLFV7_07520 [Phycisphaerae bacterium]
MLASKEFGSMSLSDRAAYLKRIEQETGQNPRRLLRRAELSEEQRSRLRENLAPLGRQRMQERMQKYFDLPAQQRTAYLDKMIDEFQERRTEWEKRRAQRQANPPKEGDNGQQTRRGREGRGHFTAGRLRQRIETSDPLERARHVEFISALRKRMQERGIRPGRGRR